MKIDIVADSSACLPEELKSRYSIEYVPISVLFEGKIYRDGVDLTPEQAYRFLAKNPKDWATSAPSPGDFLAAFKKCATRGAGGIICFTLAKSISATHSSALMAKNWRDKTN